jgi:hypothetical protein
VAINVLKSAKSKKNAQVMYQKDVDKNVMQERLVVIIVKSFVIQINNAQDSHAKYK